MAKRNVRDTENIIEVYERDGTGIEEVLPPEMSVDQSISEKTGNGSALCIQAELNWPADKPRPRTGSKTLA